jgi:hypothetical protein
VEAKETYVARANAAYQKYMELQARITKIEHNAEADHGKAVAQYKLKTGEEYWMYRDLVGDRNVQLEICHVNAAMAQIS